MAIRWNWKPDPRRVVFVDLETTSTVDLKKAGVWAYALHGSTRLLSAVFKRPDAEPLVWVPDPCKGLEYPGLVTGERVPDEIRSLLSWTWVAHNAEGFDAIVWESLYPEAPPGWLDTLPLAKALGLPGSIDKLGKLLGLGGKTDDAKKILSLIKLLGRKKANRKPDRGSPPLWKLILDYNVNDVRILEAVFPLVAEALETHSELLALHSKINEQGIAVDKKLAETLHTLWGIIKTTAKDRVEELTGGSLTSDSVRSGPKMKAWLKTQGVTFETLRREEVEAILADPEQLGEVDDLGLITEVLRERQVATRTADGKLERLVNSIDENRLRYLLVYHGAQTGRWSSRGVQVHNLPRGSGLNVEELLAEPLTVERLGEKPEETLNTLLRPVFKASGRRSLLILDFGAIEARGVAWVAGEDRLLTLFADTSADVYLDMASSLFGRPLTKKDKPERQVGKIIVLGCGYSMGPVRFEAFCKVQRINLAAVNLTGKACVSAYRERYPAIPTLWKSVNEAALAACRGENRVAGRCRFSRSDGNLEVKLPSGRSLIYRNARVEQTVPLWARLFKCSTSVQDAVLYDHPHGYPKTLYGGLITENIVQALARDLLAESMLRLDAAGFDIRLHVHDEVVIEGRPSDLERAAEIMSTPPKWAEDFPLTVEGMSCPRYSKSPFERSRHANAIRGKCY